VHTIDIKIAKPNNAAAYISLLNWLNDNQYIKSNARLTVRPPGPGVTMGAGVDVIQLALSSGFDLANLVLAIAEWREKVKEAAAAISVQVGDARPTVLSVDDMRNKNLVRRALAGAPDPRKSSCVLIGVSDYAKLPMLRAVENNIVGLEEAITDPAIWGIPADRVHTVGYPQSAAAIREAISAAAGEASDTLLVYYAGHGLYDKVDKLLLALPDAAGDNKSGTIAWSELAELIRHAKSSRRIVWLDCCYAGLALPDQETPPDLLGAAEVKDAYMLVAAQEHEEASAPDGEKCTAFTGELLNSLRSGIAPGPPGKEFLSLNEIHQETRDALVKKRRSQPDRYDPGSIGHLPHFQNNATAQKGTPTPRAESARRWRLPSWPGRHAIGAGSAALIILVIVLLLAIRPWASPSNLVGGVNLASYCSSQGSAGSPAYVVADSLTECVQKIDLDLACSYSYPNVANQTFELPNPSDPYSGICINPATGSDLGGIRNMSSYCGSLAIAIGVTATAEDPEYRNTWVCRVTINKNAACDMSYNNTPDMTAREVDGSWFCYD
jgi:Effector Associated Constant Component 1/Caspase domain